MLANLGNKQPNALDPVCRSTVIEKTFERTWTFATPSLPPSCHAGIEVRTPTRLILSMRESARAWRRKNASRRRGSVRHDQYRVVEKLSLIVTIKLSTSTRRARGFLNLNLACSPLVAANSSRIWEENLEGEDHKYCKNSSEFHKAKAGMRRKYEL